MVADGQFREFIFGLNCSGGRAYFGAFGLHQ